MEVRGASPSQIVNLWRYHQATPSTAVAHRGRRRRPVVQQKPCFRGRVPDGEGGDGRGTEAEEVWAWPRCPAARWCRGPRPSVQAFGAGASAAVRTRTSRAVICAVRGARGDPRRAPVAPGRHGRPRSCADPTQASTSASACCPRAVAAAGSGGRRSSARSGAGGCRLLGLGVAVQVEGQPDAREPHRHRLVHAERASEVQVACGALPRGSPGRATSRPRGA